GTRAAGPGDVTCASLREGAREEGARSLGEAQACLIPWRVTDFCPHVHDVIAHRGADTSEDTGGRVLTCCKTRVDEVVCRSTKIRCTQSWSPSESRMRRPNSRGRGCQMIRRTPRRTYLT